MGEKVKNGILVTFINKDMGNELYLPSALILILSPRTGLSLFVQKHFSIALAKILIEKIGQKY